jgi:outer membrane protein assembly factor BamD
MTRRITRTLAALAAFAALAALGGCAMFAGKEDPRTWTVEQHYRNAKAELDAGNYAGAIKAYEALESKFPFGRYAQQANLDIAYANYMDNETAAAVAAADKFMKLYPNHPNVDYALYIKGLAYFKPDLGIFGELLNLDAAERDPKSLRESFEVFKDLVVRFPDSIYADDSRKRMAYLVNALAKADVVVARYYLARGAYVAAVNRAENVMKRYPQAPANEDALVVAVQAYEAMGQKDLANNLRRVLKLNFPNNVMVAAPGSKSSPWWKLW